MLWSPTRGYMCDQNDNQSDQSDQRSNQNDNQSVHYNRQSDQYEHRCGLTGRRKKSQQNGIINNRKRISVCDNNAMRCGSKDTTKQILVSRSSYDKQRLTTLLVIFILVSQPQPLG